MTMNRLSVVKVKKKKKKSEKRGCALILAVANN